MNFQLLSLRTIVWGRLKGMFNLNDPRWGRGEGSSEDGRPSRPSGDSGGDQRPPQGPNQGPPDLDELWRDFNRKLAGLLGQGGRGSGGSAPSGRPSGKGLGFGIGMVVAVAIIIWLGTGFFIVQEGQQAVITQFGRYHSTVGAGFNWRLPYPIQRHEAVFVTQIRSVDVGRDNIVPATGLHESAMLTEDENIVEIKFAVQYRLNDARAYLFNSRDPDAAVRMAAETAVREVVGKMKMDQALADERDQIAPRVRNLTQTILDRYSLGIEVVGVNLQQGGVRPPEQVQAAFDDVLKAGQERERAKNEAQAYANNVVPSAQGTAARLQADAEGYKARIVAQAQGDGQRFHLIQSEYAKAPQVTRERMYLDTMQHIYSSVTKILVDTKQGSNMLYLPLDKVMRLSADGNGAGSNAQTNGTGVTSGASSGGSASVPPSGGLSGLSDNTAGNARSRDTDRSRNRDVR